MHAERYVNTTGDLDTVWYDNGMQDRLSRQDKKSQTRDRLLDAAAEVFADRGFAAATLDEVAAAAGYTKGAVYSNFSSKTDLFIALTERRIEVQTRIEARRLAAATAADGTGTAGKPVFDLEAERRWVILVFEVWLQAMRDKRIADALAEQYRKARSMSAALLTDAYTRAGLEPPMPARQLAIVVEALGVGVAFQAILDPEDVPISLHDEAVGRLLGLPESIFSVFESGAAETALAATEQLQGARAAASPDGPGSADPAPKALRGS
jgi:AcrR family transcriptional regulator